MAQGRALGHLPAHRVAEQVRRVPAERVQHRDRVIGHVLSTVGRRTPAQYRGERAGCPGLREVGGLPGIALVVGDDMKPAADELSDKGIWPPEP
jgi:hypothetical protein